MLLAQQFRQGALAVFERRAAQVFAIKLNKIEGAENGGGVELPVSGAVQRPAARYDQTTIASPSMKQDRTDRLSTACDNPTIARGENRIHSA